MKYQWINQNLIIYKKALYNADDSNENQLLEILKPIFNQKSQTYHYI